MKPFIKKFSAALALTYFSAVLCGSAYDVSQTISTPNLDTVLSQGGTVAAGRTVNMTDNALPAFSFVEGANDYLVFRTSNGVEQVRVAKDLNCLTTAQFNGATSINAGLMWRTTTSAGSTTLTTSTLYHGVTGVAGATIGLPAVATVQAGMIMVIKDEGGNASVSNIIIDPNGAELIDGAATFTMNINRQSTTIIMRNGAWWII